MRGAPSISRKACCCLSSSVYPAPNHNVRRPWRRRTGPTASAGTIGTAMSMGWITATGSSGIRAACCTCGHQPTLWPARSCTPPNCRSFLAYYTDRPGKIGISRWSTAAIWARSTTPLGCRATRSFGPWQIRRRPICAAGKGPEG